jgi:transcription elongation factor Elf1
VKKVEVKVVYEWTCPDCGHENTETDDTLEIDTVCCDKCETEFEPEE